MKKIKMLIAAITIVSSLSLVGCGKEEPKYECSDRQKAIDYCNECIEYIENSYFDLYLDIEEGFNRDGEIDKNEYACLYGIVVAAKEYVNNIEKYKIDLENESMDLSETEINNYYLDTKKEYNQYLNRDNQE